MPTAIFPFIDKPKPSTPNSNTPDNQTRTALRLEEVARLFRADAGAAGSARVGGAAATSQQVRGRVERQCRRGRTGLPLAEPCARNSAVDRSSLRIGCGLALSA